MGHTRSLRLLHHAEEIDSIKSAARDDARKVLPYLAAAFIAVMFTEVALAAETRFGQKEDIFLAVLGVASGGAAKVFKGLKRDIQGTTSHYDQKQIALYGSFKKKSKLFSSPGITRKAEAILMSDEEFRTRSLKELERAADDLAAYHAYVAENPEVSYSADIIDLFESRIMEFAGNLHKLNSSNTIPPMTREAA